MEKQHLSWIKKTYEEFMSNKNLSKVRMDFSDGSGWISMYRVNGMIRIEIKKEDTRC